MKILKSEKGQGTVELAISLVLLLIILFGIIDFGRLFHANIALNHAGREGARVMSVGSTDTEIVSIIRSQFSGLDSSKVDVSITPGTNNRKRGTYGTIHITYQFETLTPFVSSIFPTPFVINNKTVARIE
ncbi:pilus assembly protein [Evansella sp. AB-P1]|uniref:TadE/TadG family type IV pilus assembly protein n=1 Tax=Evansella sp. AB-P1 TaxID=3037653 RepID=UPI00241BEFA0|nr:TadE family protein [Evansella sp. AB-P1]MDG5788472.1 pilus assembly protein [Evansella sp. AB-P1]